MRISITLLAVFATTSLFAQDVRRVDMNFNGQLVSAVAELKAKMDVDGDLKGRKLRLGKFGGPNLPDSNFELAFERKFQKLMKGMLDDGSDFIVSGEYDFLPGTEPENRDLKVIQVTIKVVNPSRRVLQKVVREINNTEDIVEIHGSTVAPPDVTDVVKRNEAAEKATQKSGRSFHLRDNTRVTATTNKDFAVEIWRKPDGKGSLQPVIPTSVNGFAFVDLNVDDTFVIVLYTYATNCDTSAVVTIDGLDVANTFCVDKQKYDGYTIFRAKGSVPGKHIVPGWLETTQRSKKNVYSFVVNELGKGAATALKSRSRRGVINVKFFEAVRPNEKLPSRNFGEVGKGEPIDVDYKLTELIVRDTPISNVSIRYNTH